MGSFERKLNSMPKGEKRNRIGSMESHGEHLPESSFLDRFARVCNNKKIYSLILSLDVLGAGVVLEQINKRMGEYARVQEGSISSEVEAARYEGKRMELVKIFGKSSEKVLSGVWQTESLLRQKEVNIDQNREYSEESAKRALYVRGSQPEVEEEIVSAQEIEVSVGEIRGKLSSGDEQEGGVTMSAEMLKKVLRETFPKQWIDGKVTQVSEDRNDPGKMPEELGIKNKAMGMVAYAEGGKIIFTRFSEKFTMKSNLEDTLLHELGHANDWLAPGIKDPRERADLLLKVAERVSANDRYHSDYVESINNKDPHQQLYLRAQEYWAEICSQYFKDPNKLNFKDFVLVDERVMNMDPGFNAVHASDARAALVQTVRAQGKAGQL